MTPTLSNRLVLATACALSLALSATAERPVAVHEADRVRVEVAGASVALPPAAGLSIAALVGSAEHWVAAGAGADGGFAVFTGDASAAQRLPSPPRTAATLRQEPLPLLGDEGRLVGLAWLEGNEARGLAVRFSRWDGSGWEAPQTVSARGPGSQLALAATALADGRVLLAWSAFDGGDDEILWSVWDGGAWTAPARIADDNRIPDVTPTLVAVDGGALAAWARYGEDGYRVVTTRFTDDRWSTPRPVTPPGTAFPTFEPAPVAPRLLVRSALPRGWRVVELDREGAPRRSAFAAATAGTRERPVVEDVGGEVTLDWPGGELPRLRTSWTAVTPRSAP